MKERLVFSVLGPISSVVVTSDLVNCGDGT